MEVLCRCPACTAKFKVDAKYAGKKARCPKCSVIVEVPAAGSNPVSSSTTVIPTATAQAPPKVAQPVVPAPIAAAPLPLAPQPAAETSPSSSGFPAIKTTPTPKSSASVPTFSAPTFPAMPAAPTPQPIESAAPAPLPINALDTAENATPAPSDSSAAGFDFQISKKSKKATTGTSVSSASSVASGNPAPPARGKKSGSALPMIVAAAVVVVLLGGGIVGGIILMQQSNQKAVAQAAGKGGDKAGAPKNTGKLVLEWPEEDRKNGFAVLIDGRQQLTLTKGELSFDLKAGDHKVVMRRSGGYSPVETTISIKEGESTSYKPEWVKNEFGAAGGPAVATNSTPGNSGGTDFQVGMATGSPVKGFEGFTQNFYAAKEAALKSKKNILLIFASSEVDPQSLQLATATQATATKDKITAEFIPVIIDIPRTREAYANLYDSAQNKAMLTEYAVSPREIPSLILLDHKAKPYYLQKAWKQGAGNLQPYLEEGSKSRTERDELWAAVKGESLDPAVKFVSWLSERDIVMRYGDEVKQLMTVAQRLDPTNEKGQLECFLEADLRVKAVDVDDEDEIGVKAYLAPLAEWLTDKKFKDEDRGARLHLMAAGLLGKANQREDAMKHLTRAGTYNPKDKNLKDALAGAKSLIERGRILSTGTGFIVSEAGYIMTNHHVIEGRGKVIVRLPDGKTTVEGNVIAHDEDRDMAIVKIEIPAGVSLKTVPVTPETIGRGIEVAALGYPLAGGVNASVKFTKGGVSALPDETNRNMFTLDLRVNPGNSGGPLCDQMGNVVGMVTAKTRTNMFTNEDSYGMAIPSPDLVKFLDKHLPAGTPRPKPSAATAPLPWSAVDAQVSPGVLLILKME